MAIVLTVIIRNEAPMRHLEEPCSYRTVHLVMNPEQERALQMRHGDEAISRCYLEPTGFDPITCEANS